MLAARYTILRSCVDELLRTGILTNRSGSGTLTYDTLAALGFAPADVTTTSEYHPHRIHRVVRNVVFLVIFG